jgi:hypothetical protein
MIEHSENVAELFKALHQAQGQLAGVKRDSVNPHFKNRYASLENVIEAAKGPLQAHGLAFTQAPGRLIDGAVEVTTMLMHTSGQWMRSTLHVPLAKTDPQGVGSAITYGSRYSLMAALGLPPVDDDAEAALGRGSQAGPAAQSKAPAHTKPGEADLYVDTAIAALKLAKTEKALQAWFASEKTNRDKYGLKSGEGPGLRLMNAYGDHKAQLQSEVLAA